MSIKSSKKTTAAAAAAANFNDYLACYIQSEKAQLMQILTTQEAAIREIVSNIKTKYEHELSEARKLHDEMARKCAKLEIDVKRLQDDSKNLKSKLEKKTKDLQITERNAMYETAHCTYLQLKFDKLQAGSKKLAEKYRDSEKEIDRLKALLDAQKQQKGIPSRHTSLRDGKRTLSEDNEDLESLMYSIITKLNDIEITDAFSINFRRRYVKFTNESNKDTTSSGWMVVRITGSVKILDFRPTTFKADTSVLTEKK